MNDRSHLEVCVDSGAGLRAAPQGGTDRIAPCAALAIDGPTSSPGLMAIAAQAGKPVYAMNQTARALLHDATPPAPSTAYDA